MNNLITEFKKKANEYCAKYGFIPALWWIGNEYNYARNAEDKAAWHVLISILRKNPDAIPHLPKLPEIN